MTEINHSARLEALLAEDDSLCDDSDSCCTTGYDNDGSTGLDIFLNGVMIGGMAVGKTVFWAENGGQAYFFVTELSEDDFLTSLEAPVDGDGESRGGDGE